ncbi:hypothetical protein DPEC_G00026710 [Dallia pectoralis]|uniref:Uncharacterized protein n=1 Tax=Dallia pectoralis TaxID=75939 RepID=A0ACC2HHJ7_DALPE|nr:hypothetical protein DPEC_G00026710 [Dallia pectoralis]
MSQLEALPGLAKRFATLKECDVVKRGGHVLLGRAPKFSPNMVARCTIAQSILDPFPLSSLSLGAIKTSARSLAPTGGIAGWATSKTDLKDYDESGPKYHGAPLTDHKKDMFRFTGLVHWRCPSQRQPKHSPTHRAVCLLPKCHPPSVAGPGPRPAAHSSSGNEIPRVLGATGRQGWSFKELLSGEFLEHSHGRSLINTAHSGSSA